MVLKDSIEVPYSYFLGGDQVDVSQFFIFVKNRATKYHERKRHRENIKSDQNYLNTGFRPLGRPN
jgi:hypothetical protein